MVGRAEEGHRPVALLMSDPAQLSPREARIAAALAQAVIAEVRRLNQQPGKSLVADTPSIVDPNAPQEPPRQAAPD
jgi:hypothetical protein